MPEPIETLERAYQDLATVTADLQPGQLTLSTCCPAWDVRGLLNHILGGAVMYTRINAGRVASEDQGDLTGNDPAGAVARFGADNVASWREPGALDGDRSYPWGTFPATAGVIINLGEVAIHTWDLARALGRPAQIDRGVAQLVYEFYRDIPMDGMRAGGVYGPEIEVPVSAPVQERLLGFLGRHPQVSTSASPKPTGRIARASEAELLDLPDGSMMRLLADSSDTGGQLSAHFTLLAPGADGAGPHHHSTAGEVFYVLDGSVQLLVGDQVAIAAPGDLAVVPPGVVHAFAAAPGSGAQLLVTAMPGIERFEFFRTIVRVAGGLQSPAALLDQSGYDTYADQSPAWQAARLIGSRAPEVTAEEMREGGSEVLPGYPIHDLDAI